MKQAWKQHRRKRPIYNRRAGRRSDGAPVNRVAPKMRTPGSRPCGCGRLISANKAKCLGCAR